MIKKLFTPIKIGNMEVPNRFVVPAMVVNYCNEDGTATERYISYHEAKARGGWGLIITEDYAVDPRGKGFVKIPGLWKDDQIESHAKLTKRVHKYGAKIVAQIYHAGRQTNSNVIGTKPQAPSAIPCPANGEVPEELTVAEIKELVGKFGDCAYRAKLAGFDGIEIHGAHGYLIAEFMSPYSNVRNDEYGGNLLNRMRFPLEIIADIRSKVGGNFPIIFRISADEFVRGGRNVEDTKAICMILEEAGIDALHVSAGVYGSGHTIIPPYAVSHGWISDFSQEVKKVVSIPVITVGRINDPFVAEAIVTSGKADLVAMGRASIADPALPNKTAAKRYNDIIKCIACVQGCVGSIFKQEAVRCLVNPKTGREIEFSLNPTKEKKKVLIAGGGVAGMEAAVVAAKRGHEVKLYEKNKFLGGQLYIGSRPMGKGEIVEFINWQRNQLFSLGVKVNLNTVLDETVVEKENPDVVIIATGGKPLKLPIPGINKDIVTTAHDVLLEKVETGKKVVVVGGGMTGSETANYLACHSREVILIEQLEEIATDAEPYVKHYLFKDLLQNNVKVYTESKVVEILENGIVLNEKGTRKEIGPVDKVVMAVGVESVENLKEKLTDKVEDIIVIGDAAKISNAMDAIEEGYITGLRI